MQYLNIMNENKINKLVEMLCSEDLEIRKLVIKFFENQYDLDFTIYGGTDINTYNYKYSLDAKDGYGPVSLKPKDLLDTYIRSLSEIYPLIPKPSLHLAKDLIKVIIEYNESKRK